MSSPQSFATRGVSEWKDARIVLVSLKNARAVWCIPYTIEGNVNDNCARGRYYVSDTCIFGYGLPAY